MTPDEIRALRAEMAAAGHRADDFSDAQVEYAEWVSDADRMAMNHRHQPHQLLSLFARVGGDPRFSVAAFEAVADVMAERRRERERAERDHAAIMRGLPPGAIGYVESDGLRLPITSFSMTPAQPSDLYLSIPPPPPPPETIDDE